LDDDDEDEEDDENEDEDLLLPPTHQTHTENASMRPKTSAVYFGA
jgi:hypothetical protein